MISADSGDTAARQQLIVILLQSGNAAATEGRLSSATDSYRELVELRPGDADLRNNFGIILARAGDLARQPRSSKRR